MNPVPPPASVGTARVAALSRELGGESAAWAEMLARVGEKNSRLCRVVMRDVSFARSSSGSPGSLLEELDRERSRIARELHAGAGQPLAGIRLNLEMLDDCSPSLPQPAREALLRLRTLAEQALAQVRAVSHRLHPPEWQRFTIGEALRALVESSGLGSRMDASLNIEELPAQPSHSIKIALYRCAQECLGNIARHAGATRFSLSLHMNDRSVELLVTDNGRGFPREGQRETGIGLQSIRAQTGALGGAVHIHSGAEGTTIQVSIPLSEEQE
jgi:two-component system NarL family sensor kinase